MATEQLKPRVPPGYIYLTTEKGIYLRIHAPLPIYLPARMRHPEGVITQSEVFTQGEWYRVQESCEEIDEALGFALAADLPGIPRWT